MKQKREKRILWRLQNKKWLKTCFPLQKTNTAKKGKAMKTQDNNSCESDNEFSDKN